ncbi:MAG: hypothetical protein AAGB46_13505 [Verrucomicrobiota bacterium]
MKKTILALLVSLFAASIGFSANKWQAKQFADFDSDGDKALSKAEFVAQRVTMNKNSAKKNNKAFDEAKSQKWAENKFNQADANSDGKLSIEEFATSFAKKK